MKQVEYSEFIEFISKNEAMEPEIDNSVEDFVSEDHWDKNRTKVIAFTRYHNDSEIYHFIIN